MTTFAHTSSNNAPGSRRPRPTVEELQERPLRYDRLWTIENVATFLGFSLRFTENFVKDPLVPQPRLVTRGGERRWSPTAWQRWMDCESGQLGDHRAEAHLTADASAGMGVI